MVFEFVGGRWWCWCGWRCWGLGVMGRVVVVDRFRHRGGVIVVVDRPERMAGARSGWASMRRVAAAATEQETAGGGILAAGCWLAPAAAVVSLGSGGRLLWRGRCALPDQFDSRFQTPRRCHSIARHVRRQVPGGLCCIGKARHAPPGGLH